MRKILVLLLLVIAIFTGCSSYTIAQSKHNDDMIAKLKKDGKTELTYASEYSYLSEAGQITGTYNLDGNKAVVFTSLGRPAISDNLEYEIFAGCENYDKYRVYLKIKSDNGEELIETGYPGAVFKKTNEDFSASELKGIDCILNLNDDPGGNEIDSFEWLDNVFIKDGHVFGVFAERGGFERKTIYGNEWGDLISGPCSSFQYKDGWIYYIDGSMLFKMKEDGSETVQVYDKDIIDYTLEDGRILILKYVSGLITVCSLPYVGGEAQPIESVGSSDATRFNKIIGSAGGTIYLCSKIDSADNLELFSVSGNSVDSIYYTTENPTGLKPFLHNGYIYFTTYLFRGNLHRYDISTGEESVIAESLYYTGRILD